MASSKPVPRILQQRPPRESERDPWRTQQQSGCRDFQHPVPDPWSQPAARHHSDSPTPEEAVRKGDLRTQVEEPKPSKEREVGDLESAEREVHGRAGGCRHF